MVSLRALESVLVDLVDKGLFYVMDIPYRSETNLKHMIFMVILSLIMLRFLIY